jgi:hypothetical protein
VMMLMSKIWSCRQRQMEEINGVEGLWICTWDFCGCQEINVYVFLFVKACMAYGIYCIICMIKWIRTNVGCYELCSLTITYGMEVMNKSKFMVC